MSSEGTVWDVDKPTASALPPIADNLMESQMLPTKWLPTISGKSRIAVSRRDMLNWGYYGSQSVEDAESISDVEEDVPARDTVVQTPELLENILYFTGFQTLLSSTLRVNKHFNAVITASPRLQKTMFESFTSVAPEPSVPTNHFLINDALLLDTFQFPGTKESWYFGRCCWSSSREQTCRGEHFLKILKQRCDSKKGDTHANSWRKLRVLLPLDGSQVCRSRVSFGACHQVPADITLGELYDWKG